MITRTYSQAGADRSLNHPIVRFKKLLHAMADCRADLLKKDNTKKDLDPRDGYVRLSDDNTQVLGPGFYRVENMMLEEQDTESVVTVSAGKDLVAKYSYDSDKGELEVQAYSNSEREPPLVATDSLSYKYRGDDIDRSKFARGLMETIDSHSRIAHDGWSDNSTRRDKRFWDFSVFEGKPKTIYENVDWVRVESRGGRLQGLIEKSWRGEDSQAAFDLPKAPGRTLSGHLDGPLTLVDSDRKKESTTTWDPVNEVLAFEFVPKDVDGFLLGALPD